MERIAPIRKALDTVTDSNSVLKISKVSVSIITLFKINYPFELLELKDTINLKLSILKANDKIKKTLF